MRVTLRLCPQVVSNLSKLFRVHGVDGVPLSPSEAGVPLGRRGPEYGAPSLEALEESRYRGGWMKADQEMHMVLHHSDLQDPRTLLRSDSAKELGQEPGEDKVDQRRPITGRPGEMDVEAMVHPSNSDCCPRTPSPFHCAQASSERVASGDTAEPRLYAAEIRRRSLPSCSTHLALRSFGHHT